ncbi:hypothetical protein [Kineococcus sp. R86509]|uniref:hypothetical protein n=1 Tax=Kineococcus sp. R86509 TaxID=3093851 RepID=UPI0036D39014
MDETNSPRRAWRRLLVTGVAGAAALGLATATSAAADTSVATASAVTVGLLGGTAVTSGTGTASNSGSQATQNSGATPALSVLNGQSGISAGVLAQTAVARADGSSAACAGLVGAGGTITVGADGECTPSGGGPGGVQLTVGGLVVIKADAVLATCTATSAGVTTGSVKLLGVSATVLGLGGGTTNVSATAAENSGIDLSLAGLPVAQVLTRATTRPTAGSITVNALKVVVLGKTVYASIGTVTCGANAKTVPTNALPGPAAPLSAAALAVLGWRFRRPVLHALSARSGSRG